MRYVYLEYHTSVRVRLWALARIVVGALLTGLVLAAGLLLLVVWVAETLR
jgi:hypothetical protein